jgi:hypothetical protein
VDYALEIHRFFGKRRGASEIGRLEPTSLGKDIWADQERISGERGEKLIRGFAVSNGA